jgi:hypothetical protein
MAQSLVRYLDRKNPKSFITFIEQIKTGKSDNDALKEAYGITRDQLVEDWGRAIRRGK